MIAIILLTVGMIGSSSYMISKNSITQTSIQSSKYLMEQLSTNFEYNIKAIEDFIFIQVFNSELNKFIKVNNEESDTIQIYNKKRSIDNFSFNLLNLKSYIKIVIIYDEYNNYFYNSYQYEKMTDEEMEVILDKDKTTSLWGAALWKPHSEDIVFVNRVIFDPNKMNKIGIIAIGIDVNYFKDLYKNIDSVEGNRVAVLDRENNLLIKMEEDSEDMINHLIGYHNPYKKMSGQFSYNGNAFMYTVWREPLSKMKVINIIDMQVLLKGSALVTKLIIYIGIMCSVIALVIAIFLSENMTKNIKLLLRNIKRISKGNFSTRITPASYDEIGMLGIEFNSMTEKVQELINTVYHEKVQKKSAELKALQFEYDALQAKINPHFLYNTLETINGMAKIKGEYDISNMVCLLADLLRESISDKRNIIMLEEEIEHIRRYLEIQKISYRDKINVNISFDESLMEAAVPKFILQPLVENAIVHGLETKVGKGTITVSSKCDGNTLLLEVCDDGVGIEEQKLEKILEHKVSEPQTNIKHTKVGINSVNKRIKILYGDEYGIKIESQFNKGTKVLVRLPIIFEIEEADKLEL